MSNYIYKGFGDWLVAGLGYDAKDIRQGYQNDNPIPNNTNWVQMTIISIIRHSTAMYDYSNFDTINDKIIQENKESAILLMQLDFIATGTPTIDNSFDNSQKAHLILNGGETIVELETLGIIPLYTNAINNANYVGDNEQFNNRYTIHVNCNIHPTLNTLVDYFNTINIEVNTIGDK